MHGKCNRHFTLSSLKLFSFYYQSHNRRSVQCKYMQSEILIEKLLTVTEDSVKVKLSNIMQSDDHFKHELV